MKNIVTFILSIAVIALFAMNLHLFKRMARLEARSLPMPVAMGSGDDEEETGAEHVLPSGFQPPPGERPEKEVEPVATEAHRAAPRVTTTAPSDKTREEKKKLDEDIARMRALFESKMAELRADQETAKRASR